MAVLLMIPFSSAIGQDDIEIHLSLDRNKIGMNETATLTMTVSGSGQQHFPEPKLPPLPQFQIFSSGSSSSIQIINGVTSRSESYNFILSPKKEGTFPVRSATLLLNGKRFVSNELTITVLKTGTEAAESEIDGNVSQDGKAKDLFLVTEVDQKTAYVDEQVTLYVKFYRGIQTLSSPDYFPPQTPDFWSNDIPPQKNYYQVVNGRRYMVNELKMALFPTKPGDLSITPARVSVTVPDRSRRKTRDPFSLFDGIFEQGKRVEVRSKSLTVKVKPLPIDGKTERFSGGVGSYKISASVDKEQVEVNEAITLTVKISGRGNVKSIPEPVIPEMDGFRIEQSASDYKVSNIDDKLGGTKVYEYLLIPRLPGNHRIEPIALNYFDPNKRKYKDVSTAGIDLTVSQGDAVTGTDVPYNMVSGQTINLNETDIRFIKVDNGSLRPRGQILLTSPIFLVVLALPLLVVLGGMIDVRKKNRLASDVGYARQRRAVSEAKKRLKKAEDLMAGDEASFYAELSFAILQFIADKFNVSAHGLTSDGVRELLSCKEVNEELLNQTIAVLNDVDFGRFAGGADPETAKLDLFNRARNVVANLAELL
jgi:hypothetical protein